MNRSLVCSLVCSLAFGLALLISPTAEAGTNAGAVVNVCLIASDLQAYQGSTLSLVPSQITGMNTSGTTGSVDIPKSAAYGVPLCGSVGYVEEDGSASSASWQVSVTSGSRQLAVVKTAWHNNNTVVTTDGPGRWCGSIDQNCFLNGPSQIGWSDTGPIVLVVTID